MLRFYNGGLTLRDMFGRNKDGPVMTLRQFLSLVDEANRLIDIEYGGNKKEQPLTGKAAHKAAMAMFGNKKKG